MSKVKLLGMIAVVMLLCNIVLLYRAWSNDAHPNRPNGSENRNKIIERLHFDSKQIEAYDALIQDHRRGINEKDAEMRLLKKNLYSGLGTEQKSVNQDAVIEQILATQKEIELINVHHFEDIGKLCHPDQLKDYNELLNDLAEMFSHKPPPPRH